MHKVWGRRKWVSARPHPARYRSLEAWRYQLSQIRLFRRDLPGGAFSPPASFMWMCSPNINRRSQMDNMAGFSCSFSSLGGPPPSSTYPPNLAWSRHCGIFTLGKPTDSVPPNALAHDHSLLFECVQKRYDLFSRSDKTLGTPAASNTRAEAKNLCLTKWPHALEKELKKILKMQNYEK